MTLIHPLTSVRTTPPSSIREVPSPSIQDPLGEGVMVGMAPSVTCTRNEGGTDIVWVPGRRNAGHERSCGRYFSLSSERRHPCWAGSKTFSQYTTTQAVERVAGISSKKYARRGKCENRGDKLVRDSGGRKGRPAQQG